MHTSALTIIVVAGFALWWYRPLRVFLIQRTNLTVKVLLITFPALFFARLIYGISKGEQDEWLVAATIVAALLVVWIGLVWLGNTLERRRPTRAQGPDWSALSRLPGMPRLPQVPGLRGVPGAGGRPLNADDVQRATQLARSAAPHVQRAALAAAPHVQRAARAAVHAASDFDRSDVASSLGRTSGRLAARLRRSMKSPPPAGGPVPERG